MYDFHCRWLQPTVPNKYAMLALAKISSGDFG
jgi:hypothetical protein